MTPGAQASCPQGAWPVVKLDGLGLYLGLSLDF